VVSKAINLDHLNQEERIMLTRSIIGLMDSWGVENRDQVAILDLPQGTPARAINRYRDMSEALPAEPNIIGRIEHLLGIADALRTMFPHNPQMGTLWMRKRNKRLRNSPIRCMVEQGTSGLIRVRTYLDCTYAWDQSGSTA